MSSRPIRRQRRQRARPQPYMRSLNGPAQLRTNLEHTHQFRYTSTAGTLTPVTDATLLAACGVAATTTVSGAPIRFTVRLAQVEIWTPPASQGAAATCSVLWPATQRSQAREVTDTTVSVATPAHIRCGPPAESLAAFWVNGSTGTSLCFLSAPAGSIIDIWVNIVDADGQSTGGSLAVLVGATVGVVYYTCLDSLTNATGIYKPVGLTVL